MPPTDFVSRGSALVAAGQYQEAVKVCRLGLLGKPTQIDGRLVLAQALLALRRYDEVLAEMRVALELEHGLAAAHGLKGEALLRKGDVVAAREALMKAKQLAPGDPSIAALVAETDLAISSGGNRLPSQAGDPQTKHYPTHRGNSPAPASSMSRPGPSSSSFTKPEVETVARPAPRAGARGKPVPEPPDRTGTVEIDPEMMGIEVVEGDDDLGDVIDPPRASNDATSRLDTDDLVEVDETDVVEDDDATVAGRPAQQRSTSGPDFGQMFPEDDAGSGLDAILGALSAPPGGPPLRAPPTGSTPLLDPPGGRKGRPSAPPGDDMRTIRAGLGLDPDTRLPRPVDAPGVQPFPGAKRRGDDSTGIVISDAMAPPRRPHARDDETGVAIDGAPIGDGRRSERTRKVATDPGGKMILPRNPRRSRARLIVASALALVVIGGGVYGGFQIREMRLERQVAAARRDAVEVARADTWQGWRTARDVLEGVVRAQSGIGNRAALTRARAVLAVDYGDDPEGARAAVAALGSVASVDADVARGYLAILDGDAAQLDAAAAAVAALAPASGDAEYLAGRAALLAERWADAIAAFDRARTTDARPAYLLGLAEAHAGARSWPEARAAVELALRQSPDHPAALIQRARIIAGERGTGSKAPVATEETTAAVTSLERLLAESERPVEEQDQGVSPTQAAWAALALAELQVMRGDTTAARRALDRARVTPVVDRGFAVAAIHVLLALGDLSAAHLEADRAVAAWPAAAAVHVAAAEVALAEGDAARALKALEPAGELADRPEALALRGQARLLLGEVESATADLDAALAKAPDLEAALVARAELDLAAGNPRAAVTRLEKRHARGASSALAVTYAAALRGVGERDRARLVLSELTAGSAPAPAAGRAWLETARLERDGGDARAARAAYAKAIELLPDATGARLEAALLAVDTGDAAGARESLDRLVEQSGNDGRVLVEAARVHVLTGDLDGAKALLDRAETSPSAPRWQIARERGRLALRQRSFPVAIEALDRAAGLEPSDGETRLLLIDAHLGATDGAAARRVLEDVIKRFAGMPEAQLAVGRVRLYFEALDEAREAFVKAKDQLERSKAAPRWIAEATYWLGATTYYAGDPVKARALVVAAIGHDPGLADAHMLLGDIDAEKQQWKSAARSYQRVTTLDPNNNEAWFSLGEAAAASNQKKLAKKALETYLARAPTGDLAIDARELLTKLK